ncbi:hypothetical protein V2W45_1241817 [Cenococcum geophilum]
MNDRLIYEIDNALAAVVPEQPAAATFRQTLPRPSFSAMSQTIVTLNVGPNEQCFHVHRDLLMYYSPYFKAAFNSSFNAEERAIPIPDVKVSTFYMFMDWLYTERLPRTKKEVDETGVLGGRELVSSYTGLEFAELYIFADMYDVPGLRRQVMDRIFAASVLPKYAVVVLAFAKLPTTTPLCRFFVDVYCQRFRESDDDESERKQREKLPHEFLLGVMLRHAKIMGRLRAKEMTSSYKLHMCDYHEHETEEERQLCSNDRQPK